MPHASYNLGWRFPLSLLPIIKFPDPILLRPSNAVETFDGTLEQLVRDMVETMHASAGVGLAANQVGEDLRLLVIDTSAGEDPEAVIAACNPEVIGEEGQESDEEGCLSLPGITVAVRRPARLRVRYQDPSGEERISEAEGLLARVWCHELDHINGVTLLDRVSSLKRSLLKKQIRKRIEAGEWD
jgi:peptide deformylase